MTHRGYVYIMAPYPVSTGMYKIGRCTTPKDRLSGLKVSAPLAEFVRLYKCGDCQSTERLLHSLFDENRVAGEFFILDADDFEKISSIMAVPSYTHTRSYDGSIKADAFSKYISLQGTWNERDKDILDRLKEYRSDAIKYCDWRRSKGASDAIKMLYESHGDDMPPWFSWPYALEPPPRGELVNG